MVETDSSPESTLQVVLLVRWSFLSLGSSRPCVLPIHRPFSPLGFPSILCDWPVDTLPAMLEVCFSDGRKWELTAGVPETVWPSLEPVSLHRRLLGSLLLLFNICSFLCLLIYLVPPVGTELAIAANTSSPNPTHTPGPSGQNHSAVIPRTFVHHAIHFILISTVHLYK